MLTKSTGLEAPVTLASIPARRVVTAEEILSKPEDLKLQKVMTDRLFSILRDTSAIRNIIYQSVKRSSNLNRENIGEIWYIALFFSKKETHERINIIRELSLTDRVLSFQTLVSKLKNSKYGSEVFEVEKNWYQPTAAERIINTPSAQSGLTAGPSIQNTYTNEDGELVKMDFVKSSIISYNSDLEAQQIATYQASKYQNLKRRDPAEIGSKLNELRKNSSSPKSEKVNTSPVSKMFNGVKNWFGKMLNR